MSLLPIVNAANRNKPSGIMGWLVAICLVVVIIIGLMIVTQKVHAVPEQSQVKQPNINHLSSYEGKTIRNIKKDFSHFIIEFDDGRSIRVYSHKGLTVYSD